MKRKVLISTIILLVFMFLLNTKVYAKEIIVNTLLGTKIYIEAESSDTIETVKVKIQEKDETPSDEYDLLYSGNRLSAGRTLADYNIIDVNTNTIIEIDMVYANKIIFDANDGIGNMESQSFTYGKKKEISENTFTREGYEFSCWNTEKDGTGIVYLDKSSISINENIILYAQWVKVIDSEIYKITFDANDGFFKNNVTTIDIIDIINFDYESFEKPTRNGYKFIDFYTKNGKSYYEIMNSEAGVEEDITFYAQWQEVSDGEGEPGIPEDEVSGIVDPVQPDNANTDNSTTTDKLTVNNPQTSDNIMLFVIVLGFSILGLSTTTLIGKKIKK